MGCIVVKGESPNGKVIPFPQLDLRLLKKGKDHLGEGHIQEAIEFLEQASEINDENPDILYTLTAAYIKQGSMHQAKSIIEKMLRMGIGNYFETIEIYISILFQLHEYKTIEQMITLLIDEHQIPFDKMDQYQELLRLCERMSSEAAHSSHDLPEDPFKGDVSQIIQNLSLMDLGDLRAFEDEINDYLADEKQSPIVKTVLLNMLIEKHFDEPVKVVKFGKEVLFNPLDYPPTNEVEILKSIKDRIIQRFDNENPTMVEYAVTLCERFFFNIYPLEQDFQNAEIWTEAIIEVVKLYIDGINYQEDANNALSNEKESEQPLQDAIQFILEVEQNLQY